ncbi:MAG TPA: translation initiation factor IF-2 subunit gamma, partial [Thermoplasmata archaeon]|nr:translation initiation factor IF-2 subunit gamma [Thermoplasmata archaeon]
SFDVNKPGTKIENLVGGIVGGSLKKGKVKVGDVLEIRPGIKREEFGKEVYKPLVVKVASLHSGKKKYKELMPGGLIGIGTFTDPSIMKSDNLKGMVIGTQNSLPLVVNKLTLQITLLKRIVGYKEDVAVEKIRTGEVLMLTIGTTNTVGVVTSERGDVADVSLKMPVCADQGQRAAISRRIGNRWHLIGYGVIKKIKPI